VVTKIPRFTFEKFPDANDRLTTQMKSVGEVMAIGRTFQESLQKALRGLETGIDGLAPIATLPLTDETRNALLEELRTPGPDRLRYVADAFRADMPLDEVQRASRIDSWFLAQIADLVREEEQVQSQGIEALDAARMRALKRKGFADSRLASLTGATEQAVRERRHSQGIRPVYKRVDSCAAEFASATPYLYSTYDEECEAAPTRKRKIVILGGGPNRIGQGIEFDYCCVHAALGAARGRVRDHHGQLQPGNGSRPITTRPTGCTSSRSPSRTSPRSCHVEKPFGVIVQYGGQTPLKLAASLGAAGCRSSARRRTRSTSPRIASGSRNW
jgi:carbamoyl-phosphate synthase large subunit